jgi:hypothetical protein
MCECLDQFYSCIYLLVFVYFIGTRSKFVFSMRIRFWIQKSYYNAAPDLEHCCSTVLLMEKPQRIHKYVLVHCTVGTNLVATFIINLCSIIICI